MATSTFTQLMSSDHSKALCSTPWSWKLGCVTAHQHQRKHQDYNTLLLIVKCCISMWGINFIHYKFRAEQVTVKRNANLMWQYKTSTCLDNLNHLCVWVSFFFNASSHPCFRVLAEMSIIVTCSFLQIRAHSPLQSQAHTVSRIDWRGEISKMIGKMWVHLMI